MVGLGSTCSSSPCKSKVRGSSSDKPNYLLLLLLLLLLFQKKKIILDDHFCYYFFSSSCHVTHYKYIKIIKIITLIEMLLPKFQNLYKKITTVGEILLPRVLRNLITKQQPNLRLEILGSTINS